MCQAGPSSERRAAPVAGAGEGSRRSRGSQKGVGLEEAVQGVVGPGFGPGEKGAPERGRNVACLREGSPRSLLVNGLQEASMDATGLVFQIIDTLWHPQQALVEITVVGI